MARFDHWRTPLHGIRQRHVQQSLAGEDRRRLLVGSARDDTANCGAASALDNVFTGGGTISAWIRPLGWGRGTYGRIADKSFDDQAVSGGAVVYDDSSETNDPALYINGVANPVIEQVTPAGVAIDDDLALFMFGNSNSTLRTFDGLIDEVRVSRVMRSAGWIATSHANQSSPSTFYSVGSLEAR